MVRSLLAAFFLLSAATLTLAQQPFLSSEQWVKLRDEASGAAPYENLRYLTRLHRVPATAEFDQAAEFILQRAREYGLAEVQSEQFPIDGKTQYGLMRSYLGWRVEAGQLWEVRPQHLLLGDWATDPIRLADYSHTADVEAALVDVGDGSHESDYAGKDVRGKIVLADGVLARVQAAGGGQVRRRRHRERHAEPDHGMVRPGSHHGALGPSGSTPAGWVRFHGFAGHGGVIAGAAASRRADRSPRQGES